MNRLAAISSCIPLLVVSFACTSQAPAAEVDTGGAYDNRESALAGEGDPSGVEPASDATQPDASASSEASAETVWEYLSAKYDADDDGVVTEAEYTRGASTFARLDANRDAVIDARDFSTPNELIAMRGDIQARRAVEQYLQDDEDATSLSLDELFVAAEAYDANADENLVESEFRALAEARRQSPPEESMVRMMGDYDPWPALVDGVDTDADGALSFAELGLYFEERDTDGDFVWDLTSEEAVAASEPVSGPKVGTMAPDFELAPPGGGDKVRLSSFRGKKAVALIFGSYT
jgi:hypothetical protein